MHHQGIANIVASQYCPMAAEECRMPPPSPLCKKGVAMRDEEIFFKLDGQGSLLRVASEAIFGPK